MASFTLLVTQSPFQTDAHLQAMDFARAVYRSGHCLDRVFFYQDAVLCANTRIQAPQGQAGIADAWAQCAGEYGFPLQLCIANAIRRGMVNEQENERYQLDGATVVAPFELCGLGEMAEAVSQSDRVVQF